MITISEPQGATYVPRLDRARLNAQQQLVLSVVEDGAWLTLREIAGITGDPEASISARLRDLRKAGCQVERRRRGDPRAGLHEYRVRVAP